MGAMGEPWHDEVSGEAMAKHPSSASSVIAGLDPAIHAVTFQQEEIAVCGDASAWMPWSSHGMTRVWQGKG
jgi:hypothetical protein